MPPTPFDAGSGGSTWLFGGLVLGSVALVVFSIVLLLGLAVTGGVADSADTETEIRTQTGVFATSDGDTTSPASFQDTSVRVGDVFGVESVTDSTGRTIELQAGDSGYQSRSDVEFATGDTWTLSVWGEFDDSYNTTNGTLISVDGRVIIQYNNATQTWVGWYYDERERNSYRVEVDAQSQPGSMSHIVLEHERNELTIYRNTTAGGSADTSVSSTASPITNASNWAGRTEEARGYNQSLTGTQRTQLYNDPVAPLADTDRAFRLMFDSSGDTDPLYFAGTSITTTDVTRTDGFAGTELTASTDYEIDTTAGEITAVDGGRLDGAAVSYVTYEFKPFTLVETEGIGEAFGLFGVGALLIPAVAVIAVLVGTITVAARYGGGDSESTRSRFQGR